MAAKTRHRTKSTKSSKKSSAGARRRTARPSRVAARRTAPKAKTLRRAKASGKKVMPRMNSKKKTAQVTSLKQATPLKKVAERAAVTAVKKPVEVVEVKKAATQRQGFKTNEFIVYPAHGVGQIVSIEEQEVAGYKLELFVISFIKDKMTLRVPTAKIASVGMRKLAETPLVKRALETLKGRARIKRTMWSRRAQEYEAKINSGDIVAIAEVVRDLFRSDTQPEQSYSERQLYEAALDRLSREIAAVQRITETEAVKEIEAALAKGPRRGPKPADEAEAEAEVQDEAA